MPKKAIDTHKKVCYRGSHDINVETEFCIHCGKPLEEIVDKLLPCIKPDNLTSISHLMRSKRFLSGI